MPIYEFKCVDCDAEFEELTTLAEVEAGEVPCPDCGSTRVERRMSTFASGGDAPCGGGGGGCGHTGFG